MKTILMKYKSIIMYAIFGGLTTLVNLGTYYLTYSILHIQNVPSTVIAWFLAVTFAFVTNKLWVFDSKSFSKQTLLSEVPKFYGARLATGFLDVAIMYVAVDVMNWNGNVWKLISNVIVIILNYVASKQIIFKNKS